MGVEMGRLGGGEGAKVGLGEGEMGWEDGRGGYRVYFRVIRGSIDIMVCWRLFGYQCVGIWSMGGVFIWCQPSLALEGNQYSNNTACGRLSGYHICPFDGMENCFSPISLFT